MCRLLLYFHYVLALEWQVVWIIRGHHGYCGLGRWLLERLRRLLITTTLIATLHWLLICWLCGLLICWLCRLLIATTLVATLCVLLVTSLRWGIILTTTEEFELVGNNLRSIALLAILLPLAAAKATLDIDLRALVNILIHNLSKTAPQGHGVPLGMLGCLVCLTVEHTLSSSKTNTGNLNASLEATYLGILTYVTYQYNLINHRYL